MKPESKTQSILQSKGKKERPQTGKVRATEEKLTEKPSAKKNVFFKEQNESMDSEKKSKFMRKPTAKAAGFMMQ